MKPKNIKEFQELVERYETVSLDEIKDKWVEESFYPSASFITGFGQYDSCILCKKVKTTAFYTNCDKCVYGVECGCVNELNVKTYNAIEDAKTPKQLLKAFRNRAKHLRKTYPQYL